MTLFILPLIMLSPSTAHTTITSLADQRCPCTVAEKCQMKFAETDPEATLAVQQFIPACPPFQGRCCTAETMLITIIDIVQQRPKSQPVQLQQQLTHSQTNVRQNSRNPVACVFVDQCPVGNIYGTDPRHFEIFGLISPDESDCSASEEKVLCINQETNTVSARVQELPCVQPSSCTEVYGEEVSHIAVYGLQFSCDIITEVRCVTVSNPTPLPCIMTALCSEIYGTLASHFTQFGVQNSCPTSEEVRCVVPHQITTTSRRPTQTASTSISSQAPGITVSTISPIAVELPCVSASLCLEVYGIQDSHITTYGPQSSCSPGLVRCISYEVQTANPSTATTRRTTQTQTVTFSSAVISTQESIYHELPCVSTSLCHEVYGRHESHLSSYGVQVSCNLGLVRCVSYEVLTGLITSTPYLASTTRGYTTKKPHHHHIHPLFTSLAPLTPPTPSVVNIIGPSPIYIGFGENHGPSVHHSSGSIQAGGVKQKQIRELLKLLDKRLKQIAKRLQK